jgi:hypothetical protein
MGIHLWTVDCDNLLSLHTLHECQVRTEKILLISHKRPGAILIKIQFPCQLNHQHRHTDEGLKHLLVQVFTMNQNPVSYIPNLDYSRIRTYQQTTILLKIESMIIFSFYS